jgi:predicted transcriptional regulator of viral defense system
MATRLQIAAADIKASFDALNRNVLTKADIEETLRTNRQFWRLAQSTTVAKFIDFLKQKFGLEEIRIKLPNRPTVRFIWGEATTFEIVQTIRPNGYFTHFTAMYLHALTEQIPKSIYYNFEQRATGGGGQLSQPAIDRAFQNKCRVTSNTAIIRDRRLYVINGQNTQELGVVSFSSEEGAELRVTNIERTLIDISVRPVYSGGVAEVAKAFANAKGRMSLNRLVAYLKKLNFTYPYHQAIGYYLDRAGSYTMAELQPLQKCGMNFDFYLAHQMKSTDYVPQWRLFVPKGM